MSADGGSIIQRGSFIDRAVLTERPALAESRSVLGRGLLTVVGSGQASLRKNKSCNDLEVRL